VFLAAEKPPQIHHVSPRIHHDFTIKTPSQNTHFSPNPLQKRPQIRESGHPTSANIF
jgi:hypothetical protein